MTDSDSQDYHVEYEEDDDEIEGEEDDEEIEEEEEEDEATTLSSSAPSVTSPSSSSTSASSSSHATSSNSTDPEEEIDCGILRLGEPASVIDSTTDPSSRHDRPELSLQQQRQLYKIEVENKTKQLLDDWAKDENLRFGTWLWRRKACRILSASLFLGSFIMLVSAFRILLPTAAGPHQPTVFHRDLTWSRASSHMTHLSVDPVTNQLFVTRPEGDFVYANQSLTPFNRTSLADQCSSSSDKTSSMVCFQATAKMRCCKTWKSRQSSSVCCSWTNGRTLINWVEKGRLWGEFRTDLGRRHLLHVLDNQSHYSVVLIDTLSSQPTTIFKTIALQQLRRHYRLVAVEIGSNSTEQLTLLATHRGELCAILYELDPVANMYVERSACRRTRIRLKQQDSAIHYSSCMVGSRLSFAEVFASRNISVQITRLGDGSSWLSDEVWRWSGDVALPAAMTTASAISPLSRIVSSCTSTAFSLYILEANVLHEWRFPLPK